MREPGVTGPIRVLICEDRPAIRTGVTEMLQVVSGLRPTGVGTAELSDRYRAGPVGGVLVGATRDGRAAAVLLLAEFPDASVLIYAAADDVLTAALPPGVRGYFRWTPAELPVAALVGLLLAERRVAERRDGRLTARELEVLRALCRGRSNAEISRELFLAEQTVKVHVRQIFRKLGVGHRAHAVARGFRSGLID